MYSTTQYIGPSRAANAAAASGHMAHALSISGIPGLFVTANAVPHTASNRLEIPSSTTGQVTTGVPLALTVYGMSDVKDVVVWCPSKVLDPVSTQVGTITTTIHNIPNVPNCGFDVDVSLVRKAVNNFVEVATAFDIKMTIVSPTPSDADNTVQSTTYTGTLDVPASSIGEAVFCDQIKWTNLTVENAYVGMDQILRPWFATTNNGFVAPVQSVTFEFSVSNGRNIPVNNLGIANIRVTIRT
jgi:hypothetical protein